MNRRDWLKLLGFGVPAVVVAQIPDVASGKIPDVTSDVAKQLPVHLLPTVDGPEIFKPEEVVKDVFIPEIWSQESLAVLEENMVVAKLVHRDFETKEIVIDGAHFGCRELEVKRHRGELKVSAADFYSATAVEEINKALKQGSYHVLPSRLTLTDETMTLKVKEFMWECISYNVAESEISFYGRYHSARATLKKRIQISRNTDVLKTIKDETQSNS